jgi:hypothetical protein
MVAVGMPVARQAATKDPERDQGVRPTADRASAIFAKREDFGH